MTDSQSYSSENEFNPEVLDLFCGPGGLSEGLKRAGFKILAGVDNEKNSIKTFEENHSEALALNKNLKNMDVEEMENEIETDEVFLIAGGPPCQGFSLANQQEKIDSFIDDPRNVLYREFVRFVNYFNPKYFLMENVPQINKVSDDIKRDFQKIGYAVDSVVLNAKNFEIPQNRKRAFFIGMRSDENEFWKAGTVIREIFENILSRRSERIVPLESTFWGLREIEPLPKKHMTDHESEEHGFTVDQLVETDDAPPEYILKINGGEISEKVYNHKARYQNDRDLEIFRKLPPGGDSTHPSIQDINPYKERNDVFKDKFYKLPPDEPCKTITSHMKYDCHMYIHPYENRGLSPREAARVQSFPDDYRFYGPFTRWYMQIGNAIPPLLAEVIGRSIKKVHTARKEVSV